MLTFKVCPSHVFLETQVIIVGPFTMKLSFLETGINGYV